MIVLRCIVFLSMNQISNKMLTLGTFQLTHPEVLSEADLREILENSCIDFNTYKYLSRDELIDLYKRVAMPLPQRQCKNIQNLNTKRSNVEKDVYLNGTSDVTKDMNETKTFQYFHASKPKSPVNEFKYTSKKVHLYNSNNIRQCNGVNKRINDDKYSDTPSKKRQKITWP